MKRLVPLVFLALSLPVQAAPTLTMPESASQTVEDRNGAASFAMPVGPWRNGAIESLNTEGEVTRSAWRIRDTGAATLTILSELRDQLSAEGFEIIYECETDQCGGFDFRFGIPVLPEPDMHVDLGDFRFLSARRQGGDGPDYVSLLVSRSSDSGYVQMWRVGSALTGQEVLASSAPRVTPTAPDTVSALADSLVDHGKIVLSDLSFGSGATTLSEGTYPSLGLLADYLKANPDKSIALVGHTDAEGSLAANVTLSRKRAQSVLDALATDYGVDRAQMSADGVGYLSPLASNLTEAGRTKNRRVEALITSTR